MSSRLATRLQRFADRARLFVVRSVLHADDPPHKLALGVAIGVFVTFTPTVGLQMGLTLFLAWLLRANKVVGLPFVWITNPATFVPIYYPCYVLGRSLLGIREHLGLQWWRQLAQPPEAWNELVLFYWRRTLMIAAPLWVGCLVVALGLAVPSYLLTYFGVRFYRQRRVAKRRTPRPDQHRPRYDRSDAA